MAGVNDCRGLAPACGNQAALLGQHPPHTFFQAGTNRCELPPRVPARFEPASEVCAWQERVLHGLGVSLLALRPWGELASDCCKATTTDKAALACLAGFTQSQEGRNVYIGVGTVLVIILIVLLLIWVF